VRCQSLIDSYDTERVKVLSVWSEFRDDDLTIRPRQDDPRGRSVLEQMVHQCVSEDTWFRNMLGIDVGASPLPERETRHARTIYAYLTPDALLDGERSGGDSSPPPGVAVGGRQGRHRTAEYSLTIAPRRPAGR
jgi:hypothetical protein